VDEQFQVKRHGEPSF